MATINERAAELLERMRSLERGSDGGRDLPNWMMGQAFTLLDELAETKPPTTTPHPSIADIHAEVQRMASEADTPQAAVALQRVAGMLAGAVGGVPREAVEQLRDAAANRCDVLHRGMHPEHPDSLDRAELQARFQEIDVFRKWLEATLEATTSPSQPRPDVTRAAAGGLAVDASRA